MSQDQRHSIETVKALLSLNNLSLPVYQRPYKWGEKQVQQLFADLESQKNYEHYRLGTIVLHESESQIVDKDGCKKTVKKLDIVDGQQRILTLLLIMKAVIDRGGNDPAIKAILVDKTAEGTGGKTLEAQIEARLASLVFSSQISQYNLANNFQIIQRLVNRPEFTVESLDFLLNRCEVVLFTLTDITEAFQFFDAQNSRGRDLDPHDLLKAFHLRAFSKKEEVLKQYAVDDWESRESHELATLFGDYLYRTRQWIQGRSARYFTKKDVDLFKGVDLDKDRHIPLSAPLRILHHYVDHYNHQFERQIDGAKMPFPFQLEQTIINGRRFFEMTAHYQNKLQAEIRGESLPKVYPLTDRAKEILTCLNHYSKRYRTGDRYVRMLFDCVLMLFIDKFGEEALSLAIEKIFIWAYSCRLRQYAVQLATVDNYARGKHDYNHLNLFKHFHESMTAHEALFFQSKILQKRDLGKDFNPKDYEIKDKAIDAESDEHLVINRNMLDLFKALGYYLEESQNDK